MQERHDKTFGEIKPYSEFMKKLNDDEFIAETKAIHFGTREELDEIKNKGSLEKRIDEMERKYEELVSGKKQESPFLDIATPEEIKKYATKWPMDRNMSKIMHSIAQK